MATAVRASRTRKLGSAVLGLLLTCCAPCVAEEEPPGPPPAEQPAPTLVLRGFGDVNLVHRDDGTPGGFSLGELDLFLTSELAPDLSVLAEIVLEPQEGDTPEIEIERFALRWAPRDFFKLELGRMHTPLGYWNQAYHHGKWFQTTIERPIVYRWEHDGGVLPVHEVGFAMLGEVRVSALSVEYSASVSNGRGPDPGDVQDFQDDDSHKAVNLWLGVGPRSQRALRLGGVFRSDRIPGATDAQGQAGPALEERIAGAFIAFTPRRGEALAELLHVEHEATDTRQSWRTLGLYVQGALKLGRFKPYYRYDYLDVAEGDPFYRSSGVLERHTVGVRYDPWSWAALKLELFHESPTPGDAVNAIAFQAAFTF